MNAEDFPCLILGAGGQRFPVCGRIVTIGGAAGCHVRLTDCRTPQIGHLLFSGGEYRLQRLAAVSLLVNGKPLDGEVALRHGDVLTVDKRKLTYLEREQDSPAFTAPSLQGSPGHAREFSDLIAGIVSLLRNRECDVSLNLVTAVCRLLKCDAARLVVENPGDGARSTVASYPAHCGPERFSNRVIDWARDKARTIIMHDFEWQTDAGETDNSLVKNSIASVLCGALAQDNEILGYLYLDRLRAGTPFTEDDRTVCDTLLPLFSEILAADRERRRQADTIARFQTDAVANAGGMIYECDKMTALLAAADKMARTDAPILISGETGTGKELITRFIHAHSQRAGGPFKAINSGAIPAGLIESELFGYEKGAFTGATQRKIGLFEAAQGGTLFLDEVGELPLPLQVKLLRALQESEIVRVGGANPIAVDVRIITATNRDLSDEVANQRFRSDLYFRLNVLAIEVPPLRERGSDIIILAEYFILRYCQRFGVPPKRLAPDAVGRLMRYRWPGNIRELENVIQKAIIAAEGPQIHTDAIRLGNEAAAITSLSTISLQEARAHAERQAIIAALTATHGNVSAASSLLEIDRKWLMKKMEELGVAADTYRKDR
jgi:DNA-binding NtrC family response regulator